MIRSLATESIMLHGAQVYTVESRARLVRVPLFWKSHCFNLRPNIIYSVTCSCEACFKNSKVFRKTSETVQLMNILSILQRSN